MPRASHAGAQALAAPSPHSGATSTRPRASAQTTPLAAFDKVANVPDEYVPQEDKDTVPKEDDIHSWLTDERGRDQFAIRFAEETEIYWNDAHQSKPDEVYKRNCWTESYVQWSTRGHYLATIHRQGAALWGGPGFPRLQRFAHPGVQFLDFSPAEKYLVTCSIRDPTNARESTTITVRASALAASPLHVRLPPPFPLPFLTKNRGGSWNRKRVAPSRHRRRAVRKALWRWCLDAPHLKRLSLPPCCRFASSTFAAVARW